MEDAKQYGVGLADAKPGVRGELVTKPIALPRETWELMARMGKGETPTLSDVMFVEHYIMALALAMNSRDPSVTARLRRQE